MDADLQPVYERVMQAARPEDAFKPLTVLIPPRLLAQHLSPELEEMRAVLDPGAYLSPDDQDAARLGLERLDALYESAIARAGRGLYGLDDHALTPLPPGGKVIAIGGHECVIGARVREGQYSTLYKGRVRTPEGSGGIVFKVANASEHNPYLFNEIRMMDLLHKRDVGYWRNIPFMLGRFMAGERVGIAERYFEGLTLSGLRANRLHKDGLDQRHMVWVMDRMLGLLWYMHTIGVIHGQINPDRVRVRPSNHNALLTGWGHAVYRPVTTGERVMPSGGAFEAPEVTEGGTVGPWTDIYSLGKTLIWLCGGDPQSNEMPDSVEDVLQRFLRNMVRKSPRARPRDAKQLYDAQNRIKDSLWERRFLHLNLA